MKELLTASQMRAIEQAAIESGEVTGLELMERAGRGVVEAIFEEWPELSKTSYRAVVLCGPGNNGGDGFVVARLLKEWGWEVEVFLYGDETKLPADAKVNCERWRETGEVLAWDDRQIEDKLDESDHELVVDALFGTGLTRAMPDDISRTWQAFVPRVFSEDIADRPKYVAIDIASGVCSDSGRNLEGALPTDLSVSFHRAKLGHYLSTGGPPMGGANWTKRLAVKDIGLNSSQVKGSVRLVAPNKAALTKFTINHKFSHGHALVLSGGVGKGGAARLTARGALRIGAGLVTVGCPPSALIENAAQLNAIMLQPMKDADALEEALKDERITALCLGPGMGISERTRDLTSVALKTGRPLVLDADALSVLFFDEADALFGRLHDKCVLTPHGGEFARLFPDIAEKLHAPATKGPAYSKVDATREAAKRAGCVVLFKGPDTVIAAPDGRASINSAHYERSAPWLATAGSGDVLAGFITGLLARVLSPKLAAETAAWLHVECARSFGPGLIAEDIPEELPKVLKTLEI